MRIVTLSSDYNDQLLTLYNLDDSSLWHEFSYVYDDSDGQYECENSQFRPYVFHPDYYQLGMISRRGTATAYVVEVDEAGTEKLIFKAPYVKRVSLDEYFANFSSLYVHEPTEAKLLDGGMIRLQPGAYSLHEVLDGKAILLSNSDGLESVKVSMAIVQDGRFVVSPLLE